MTISKCYGKHNPLGVDPITMVRYEYMEDQNLANDISELLPSEGFYHLNFGGAMPGFFRDSRACATNGGCIHTAGSGEATVVLSVPVRYAHAPCGIASYANFKAMTELAADIIRSLSQEVIAGF